MLVLALRNDFEEIFDPSFDQEDHELLELGQQSNRSNGMFEEEIEELIEELEERDALKGADQDK